MYIFTSRLRPITIIVLLYFAAFTTIAISIDNLEFMLYEAVMVLLIALIVWMDKRVEFSKPVLWMLAIWGALHLAGGLIPIPDSLADLDDGDTADKVQVLYNLRLTPYLPRFDQLVHAFGFGICALAAREALAAHLNRPIPINMQMGSVIILIAMGLGAVNEILEFAAVMLIPDTSVGGYINTGWDLVCNGIGAGIAILWMKVKN